MVKFNLKKKRISNIFFMHLLQHNLKKKCLETTYVNFKNSEEHSTKSFLIKHPLALLAYSV